MWDASPRVEDVISRHARRKVNVVEGITDTTGSRRVGAETGLKDSKNSCCLHADSSMATLCISPTGS